MEFAVVNVSALPSKQAYSYHDDSLEQPPNSGSIVEVRGNTLMKPPLDLYDDSSSAINEQLSSSDVPQTPENPNVTFLPLEAGPVIVGCHQGVVSGLKQYYVNAEERIYDVPEGIEGISAPIKIIRKQTKASAPMVTSSVTLVPEVITSPSSSSGITEPFVLPHLIQTTKPAPTSAPPPPPHQPVIAQPVARHGRPPHLSRLTMTSKLTSKVDLDPRKFNTILSGAMEPQDSTESCDSNSMVGTHAPPQRPLRPARGRGSSQPQHYSTTTLPPPQRLSLIHI